ncbi:hypothetical protein AB0J43_21170 [Nonomuraea fuscirosea]
MDAELGPSPLTQEEIPHAHPLRRHPSGGDAPCREGGRRLARLTADTSRPPRGRPRPQEWLDQRFQAVGQVGFPVPSGSITTLREDDYFHNRAVVGLGDIRHLGSAESEAG